MSNLIETQPIIIMSVLLINRDDSSVNATVSLRSLA